MSDLISAIFAFLAASMLVVALLVPVFIAWIAFLWRILTRAGYSGWWSLTSLVPPVFVILVWLMAFARRWPAETVVYYAPENGGGGEAEILPPRPTAPPGPPPRA